MSETIDKDSGINININNSDSQNSSGGGFLDRIFDLGIKLVIPIILVFALFSVIIFFTVVLPLLESVSDLVLPILDFSLPFSAPISAFVGGLGAIFGYLTGGR